MKKFLFFSLAFLMFLHVSSVRAFETSEKMLAYADCTSQSDCNCKKQENKSESTCCDEEIYQKYKKTCDKCSVEDDEYCVYNECYFDKHYRKMKKTLCLTSEQEECIDKIYRNFKADMENLYTRYRVSKNRLLDLIECEHRCYKEQKNALKEAKNDMKEKIKEFRDDVKEQLCKKQRAQYAKFVRAEKRKLKKITKYSALHKLPCTDCCK